MKTITIETETKVIEYFESMLNTQLQYYMKSFLDGNSVLNAVDSGKQSFDQSMRALYPALVWEWVKFDTKGPIGIIDRIKVKGIALEGFI
jgi:hypothetical protein